MKHPRTILVLTVLGLSSIWGCDTREAAIAGWVPEIPEGYVGILESGEISTDESDVTWTVFVNEPLSMSGWLESSDGQVSWEDLEYITEGGGAYDIDFTDHKVLGNEVLESVKIFGDDESHDALAAEHPGIEESYARRFSLVLTKYPDVEWTDEGNFEFHFKGTAVVSSGLSGWIPDSLTRRGEEHGSSVSSLIGGGSRMELRRIGEPIYLIHYVTMPAEYGSFSVNPDGEELMITYSIGSGEEKVVPLSEYPGKAWALKVTFSEREEE